MKTTKRVLLARNKQLSAMLGSSGHESRVHRNAKHAALVATLRDTNAFLQLTCMKRDEEISALLQRIRELGAPAAA